MKPFSYVRPVDASAAIAAAGASGANFLAGGTTLIDLMRLRSFNMLASLVLVGLASVAVSGILRRRRSSSLMH